MVRLTVQETQDAIQEIRYCMEESFVTSETVEQFIKEHHDLSHEYDCTRGLWCTDKLEYVKEVIDKHSLENPGSSSFDDIFTQLK